MALCWPVLTKIKPGRLVIVVSSLTVFIINTCARQIHDAEANNLHLCAKFENLPKSINKSGSFDRLVFNCL